MARRCELLPTLPPPDTQTTSEAVAAAGAVLSLLRFYKPARELPRPALARARDGYALASTNVSMLTDRAHLMA